MSCLQLRTGKSVNFISSAFGEHLNGCWRDNSTIRVERGNIGDVIRSKLVHGTN